MAAELPGMAGVDGTAFEAFSMGELTSATFDEGLREAGDTLAIVFFRGVDCLGKTLGPAIGWHGLPQFRLTVVAARGKIAAAGSKTGLQKGP